MRTLYRLDKSFGPGGSFAGMILLIVGMVLVPFYWTAAILILLGAFTGFSGTGCELDRKNHLIRPCQLHFGLFREGKWMKTDLFQGLRVVRTDKFYRTFSLSNRTMETKQEDFRVVMESGTTQPRVEIMKFPSREIAIQQAQKLADELGMKLLDH